MPRSDSFYETTQWFEYTNGSGFTVPAHGVIQIGRGQSGALIAERPARYTTAGGLFAVNGLNDVPTGKKGDCTFDRLVWALWGGNGWGSHFSKSGWDYGPVPNDFGLDPQSYGFRLLSSQGADIIPPASNVFLFERYDVHTVLLRVSGHTFNRDQAYTMRVMRHTTWPPSNPDGSDSLWKQDDQQGKATTTDHTISVYNRIIDREELEDTDPGAGILGYGTWVERSWELTNIMKEKDVFEDSHTH